MPEGDDALGKGLADLGREQPDLAAELMRAAIRKRLVGVESSAQRLGRFEVRGLLGRGGMGAVYTAWDPRLERNVALKVITSEHGDDDRLLGEARVLAKLAHPNVVAIYDAELIDDQVVIAMEWVDGRDLRRALGDGKLSRNQALGFMIEVGNGLQAAHESGLVHRDVKPENILIGRDGRARVSDFGLARPSSNDSAPRLQILGGTTRAGTPAYMAPEQLAGERVDARTDQFGFCLTLVEALGGSIATWKQLRAPNAVRSVIARGLAPRIADRYPSMRELVRHLERARRAPARRWALAGVVTVVAALVVAFGAVTRSNESVAEACETRFPPLEWNAIARTRIIASFANTKSPLAADSASRVAAAFDRYAGRLRSAVRSACGVTSAGPARDHHLACLQSSVRKAGFLIDAFASFSADDAARVASAVTATSNVLDVEACDTAAPSAAPPPALASSEVELDRAETLFYVGKQKDALALLDAALPAIEATGYAPLIGRAKRQLGSVQLDLEDVKAADASFHAGLAAAERAGDDRLAVECWRGVVNVARHDRRYADADAAATQLRAKIARVGDPPELVRDLHLTLGALANERSDYATARHEYEAGLALTGAGDRENQEALAEVGLVYSELGEHDLELSSAQTSVTLAAQLYGENHPRYANALRALSMAYYDRGDLDKAKVEIEHALVIFEAFYGNDAPKVGKVLNYLAIVDSALGKLDLARPLLERSIAILEKANGPNHPILVTYLTNLASMYEAQPAKAAELLDRALVIARANDKTGEQIAQVLGTYANIEVVTKHFAAALAKITEARAIDIRLYGAGSPQVEAASISEANALLELGRPREVIPLLTSVAANSHQLPQNQAIAGEDLAQALWRTGDHARAMTVGRAALAIAPKGTAAAAEIAAWVAHPN